MPDPGLDKILPDPGLAKILPEPLPCESQLHC